MRTPKGTLQALHCPCCNETRLHDVYSQPMVYKTMNKVLTLADCLTCMNTRVLSKVINGVETMALDSQRVGQ
jgi:hypothetical protein